MNVWEVVEAGSSIQNAGRRSKTLAPPETADHVPYAVTEIETCRIDMPPKQIGGLVPTDLA